MLLTITGYLLLVHAHSDEAGPHDLWFPDHCWQLLTEGSMVSHDCEAAIDNSNIEDVGKECRTVVKSY